MTPGSSLLSSPRVQAPSPSLLPNQGVWASSPSLLPTWGSRALAPPRSPTWGFRPYPLLPKPKGSGPLLALTHLNFETGNCVCSLTLEVRDQEGRAGRNWVRKLKTPLPRCPAGSGSLDYTQGNLVRLGLAGLVLLSLGTLVFLDWSSRSRIPCSVRP